MLLDLMRINWKQCRSLLRDSDLLHRMHKLTLNKPEKVKTLFSITPEASGLPFTVLRRQYPIIPAYCLSVHKAQGQSLHKVGLIFESDPFTHGQLYVALSRVACWLCIVVMMHEGECAIKNLVHKHLL